MACEYGNDWTMTWREIRRHPEYELVQRLYGTGCDDSCAIQYTWCCLVIEGSRPYLFATGSASLEHCTALRTAGRRISLLPECGIEQVWKTSFSYWCMYSSCRQFLHMSRLAACCRLLAGWFVGRQLHVLVGREVMAH